VHRALYTCQDSVVKLGNCGINEHVCYGIVNWSTTYQATATEPVSVKVATSDQNSGGEGAAQQATWRRLSTQLGLSNYNSMDCSCQSQDILNSMCMLRVAVCFNFPSQTDMTNGQPYYNGFAFDLHDPAARSGKSTGNTNATLAGQQAAAQLFELYPVTAKSCGQGKACSWQTSRCEGREEICSSLCLACLGFGWDGMGCACP